MATHAGRLLSPVRAMPDLGLMELLLVGIVLLIAVGPERLPHATRTLGRLYGRMRRAADELRNALVLEADRMDEEERLRALRKRRLEAERKKREAEEATGGRAQSQEQDETTDEQPHDDAEDGDADGLPPGFTAEEWAELPDHIRDIVRKRQHGGTA